jgi:aldehyde dehydrogenase (NAD+)
MSDEIVRDRLFIGGAWVPPAEDGGLTQVVNAADGSVLGRVPLGGLDDVDRAVSAARRAFETWSQTRPEERVRALAPKRPPGSSA